MTSLKSNARKHKQSNLKNKYLDSNQYSCHISMVPILERSCQMIAKFKILLILSLLILSNVIFTSIAMEKETTFPKDIPTLKKFKRSLTNKRFSRSSSQSSNMLISPQTVSIREKSTLIASRESRNARRNSSESDIDDAFGVIDKKKQEFEDITIQPCQFLDLNPTSKKKMNVLQVDWCFYTGDQIVEELTRRDMTLMQSISIDNIDKFFKDQENMPDAIQNLAKSFDGTTKWLTSIILNEKDISERRKLAQFFLLMGRSLYIIKNYHTTMQFALAFMNSEVEILFEYKGVNSLKSEEFFCIFNPLKNYAQYRQNLFSDNLEHTHYLPAFPIFTQDLVIANESNNQHALPMMIQIHFEQWNRYPLPASNEKNKEVFDFVSRFYEL